MTWPRDAEAVVVPRGDELVTVPMRRGVWVALDDHGALRRVAADGIAGDAHGHVKPPQGGAGGARQAPL